MNKSYFTYGVICLILPLNFFKFSVKFCSDRTYTLFFSPLYQISAILREHDITYDKKCGIISMLCIKYF